MSTAIQCFSANEAWKRAAKLLLSPRKSVRVIGRGGLTSEVPRVVISISNPRDRWIVSRTPPLNVAFALAEVVWLITGRRDSQFLTFWNSRLPKYQGHGSNFHGAYGYRLRSNFTFDQLDRAYGALKGCPSSRQVVLQIWNGEIDFPSDGGNPSSMDVPCNIVSMLKVRANRLYWTQVVRSNDLFLGLPHNVVQFTYLQELMAGWLGLELGTYNHFADSLHVYEEHFKNIQKYDRVSAKANSDCLVLSKAKTMRLFMELADRVEILTNSNMSRREFKDISNWPRAPQEMLNILNVFLAEYARKRHWVSESEQALSDCKNLCFVQMQRRWVENLKRRRHRRGEQKESES